MIVRFFQNNTVKKLQKHFTHKSCFLDYPEIKTVVILFDFEHRTFVQDFAEVLRKEGKVVFAYSYLEDKKNPETSVLQGFTILKPDSMNFRGEILPVELEKFRLLRPDTLLDLTVHPHPALQILSLLSEASYRSGFAVPGKPAGDLLLEYQEEKSMDFLLQQLHFYLRTLHSK